MSIFVYGLHYFAFGLALLCLGSQMVLLTKALGERVLLVSRIDAVYGLAAAVTLITGILRAAYFGKGLSYYLTHSLFWTKVGMFAVIGLLSIYPTVQFLKNRNLLIADWRSNRSKNVEVILFLVRCEMFLYLLIPFVAAALSHGPHF